jgi:hypothetical protein
MRTVGNHLVIAGGPVRGVLYGVYGLLEDHLGCRWFTPDCSRIPKKSRLTLGPVDERRIPAFEYREVCALACFDADWCARNRLNSFLARLDEPRGGKIVFGNGLFVHSFAQLVAPEDYFADHPEYFAMVHGERMKEYREQPPQLCCTNPEVIAICVDKIRDAMRAQPDATVFSVSQNDSFEDGYCECPECRALAEREGSQLAPILQLVNRVAEAVEKDFPDKIVETLAYQWSQRPPKEMRPRPNVVVRLCTSNCCFLHPLATCTGEYNLAFRTNLENWSKICPRLWVWDYTTDFAHYLLPFPNLRTLAPNVRFFAAHNVKGLYEEGPGGSEDTEFQGLRCYLLAKLLWNPQCDAEAVMRDFLEGYYGKASKPIREYIDLLHRPVEQEDIHVNGMAGPESPHLKDDMLLAADKLWERAESMAADNEEILHRVRIGRMSVDYAIVERARLEASGDLPANEALAKLARDRFLPFMESLDSSNLTRLAEPDVLDREAYGAGLARDLKIAE